MALTTSNTSISVPDMDVTSLTPIVSRNNLRQMLASSIAGQSVHLPDLHASFDGWDQGTNKHVEKLRADVDQHLTR